MGIPAHDTVVVQVGSIPVSSVSPCALCPVPRARFGQGAAQDSRAGLGEGGAQAEAGRPASQCQDTRSRQGSERSWKGWPKHRSGHLCQPGWPSWGPRTPAGPWAHSSSLLLARPSDGPSLTSISSQRLLCVRGCGQNTYTNGDIQGGLACTGHVDTEGLPRSRGLAWSWHGDNSGQAQIRPRCPQDHRPAESGGDDKDSWHHVVKRHLASPEKSPPSCPTPTHPPQGRASSISPFLWELPPLQRATLCTAGLLPSQLLLPTRHSQGTRLLDTLPPPAHQLVPVVHFLRNPIYNALSL